MRYRKEKALTLLLRKMCVEEKVRPLQRKIGVAGGGFGAVFITGATFSSGSDKEPEANKFFVPIILTVTTVIQKNGT